MDRKRVLIISGAAVVLLLVVVSAFFGTYIRTQILPEQLQKGGPPRDGETDIVTNRILVRLNQQQAVALRATPEGKPPPTPPASPSPDVTETPSPSPTASPTPEGTPSPSPTTTPTPSLGTSPTPSPSGSPGVLGVTDSRQERLAAAKQAVPRLGVLGDLLVDLSPVVALGKPSAELADIDRWFVITLPGEERSVHVKDQTSLEPIGKLRQKTDLVSETQVSPVPLTDVPPPVESGVSERESVSDEDRKGAEQVKVARDRLDGQNFEKVEPVLVMRTAAIPNDPYFASSGTWGQPYDDLWGLKRIQAPAAWDVTTGSPNVTIAVVDTGLDFAHRDLQGNIWENPGETGMDSQNRDKKTNGVDDDLNGYIDDWRGWDFANSDNDPTDDHGHGTHVAGTIAAVGNNGTDVVGVLWSARLMPLKFLNGQGAGTSANGAAAIRYAATQGARVINNSWEGFGFSTVIRDAVNFADAKGALSIAAAGNSDSDLGTYPHTPASEPAVVAVSALTPEDARASFSNFGSKIELTAPGGDTVLDPPSPDFYRNIVSLRAAGTSMGMPVDLMTTRAAGTSMASPHVAGAAGLLLALHPEWTNIQVRGHLQQTADDIGVQGRDADFGFGVVDIARAVGAPTVTQHALESPESFAVLERARTSVRGSASSAYVLDIGEGYRPTQWTTLRQQDVPVSNGELGEWNPSQNLPTNIYTLRLTTGTNRLQLVRRVFLTTLLTGSLSINGGAASTTTPAVTLTLSATDVGYGMKDTRLRNAGATWSAWEAYATTKSWTLSFGDGTKTVEAQFRDAAGNVSRVVTDSIVLRTGRITIGADAGADARVRMYHGATLIVLRDFDAFPGFGGGVRVAIGDINGDGKDDIFISSGPGARTTVRVYSGADGSVLRDFFPFGTFTGGAYVGAGDVNGDGKDDIIVGSGPGAKATVRVYSGVNNVVLRDFFPFGDFTGGVRVAGGDINGDKKAEILIASGPGAEVTVRAYSGADNTILRDFFPFPKFTGGGFIGAGDVNADGKKDIILGSDAGARATVRVYSGADGSVLSDFFPFQTFTGGVRVAGGDTNNDGWADIITGSGPGALVNVTIFSGKDATVLRNFSPFNQFTGGVFVGGY